MTSFFIPLFRVVVACSALKTRSVALALGQEPHGDKTYRSIAQHVIEFTKSIDVLWHVDLHARGSRDGAPWMEGFPRMLTANMATAATISHPIRRMLAHLRLDGVGLEEAMTWGSGKGTVSLKIFGDCRMEKLPTIANPCLFSLLP